MLLLSGLAQAESVGIGQVYDIAEPDAYEQIMDKVKTTDWEKELSKEQDDWSVFQGVELPIAQENKRFSYVPWYTTEFSIKNPKTNQVMYPKGFTFNPLAYAFMPNRIIVINKYQADWAMAHKKPTDMIIVTHGNVLKLKEKYGQDFFILDKKTKDRIGVKAVPSIITQVKQRFVISEYKVDEDEN